MKIFLNMAIIIAGFRGTYALGSDNCMTNMLKFSRANTMAYELDPASFDFDSIHWHGARLSERRAMASQQMVNLRARLRLLDPSLNLYHELNRLFEGIEPKIILHKDLRDTILEFMLATQNKTRIDAEFSIAFRRFKREFLHLKNLYQTVNVGPLMEPRSNIAGASRSSFQLKVFGNETQYLHDDALESLLVRRAQNDIMRFQIPGHVEPNRRSGANLFYKEELIRPEFDYIYRVFSNGVVSGSRPGEFTQIHSSEFDELLALAHELNVKVYFDASLSENRFKIAGLYLAKEKEIRLSTSLITGRDLLLVLRHELEHARFDLDVQELAMHHHLLPLSLARINLNQIRSPRLRNFIHISREFLLLEHMGLDEVLFQSTVQSREAMILYNELIATEAAIDYIRLLKSQGWKDAVDYQRDYANYFISAYFTTYQNWPATSITDIVRQALDDKALLIPRLASYFTAVGGVYILMRTVNGNDELIAIDNQGRANYYSQVRAL